MTIDVTQQLNYSQAVRKARPDWDDDKVRKAAEYLVLYMDVDSSHTKLMKSLTSSTRTEVFYFEN